MVAKFYCVLLPCNVCRRKIYLCTWNNLFFPWSICTPHSRISSLDLTLVKILCAWQEDGHYAAVFVVELNLNQHLHCKHLSSFLLFARSHTTRSASCLLVCLNWLDMSTNRLVWPECLALAQREVQTDVRAAIPLSVTVPRQLKVEQSLKFIDYFVLELVLVFSFCLFSYILSLSLYIY
jgi:hypothetical protein